MNLFIHKHSEIDMLHGSLSKAILRYAIPYALSGILQQLFNAADVAVVGQFVGKEAMAAVGAAAPIIALLVNFFLGISLGTNIVIAQMTGAGDGNGVKKAVHTSVLFALSGGIVVAVAGELAAAPLLSMLSVPDEVLPMALVYLRIYFAGVPAIALCNFISAIMRSRGDSRTPTVALVACGAVNVMLNVLFVRVFSMTVDGVAWATLSANAICALILVLILMRRDDDVRLSFKELRIDGGVLKRILYIGVPSGFQSMVFQLANIYLQGAINSLGTTAMAACAASSNIESMNYYLLQSFGYACSTFVGQNHGAGNDRRCNMTIRRCLLLDYAICSVIFTFLLLFRYRIMGLFNPDPEVIRLACIRLVLLIIGSVFSISHEVCSGHMRGYGKPLSPTVISLVCICGIRFFWVAFVFPAHHDFIWLMAVYPISLAATSISLSLRTFVFASRSTPRKSRENTDSALLHRRAAKKA